MSTKFDPRVQEAENGPLLENFRKRIRPAKERHSLTWWGMAELAEPPFSGSYLGNRARYPGGAMSTDLANRVRDLVQALEALEPGSLDAEEFLNNHKRHGDMPKSPGGDGPAIEACASQKNLASGGISIEAAVRALREHGFEVTLVAR